MLKSLVVLAIFGTMSVPAASESIPVGTNRNEVQPAKPRTVKKVVCQRVDEEETTGSRLGSAPKVCKTVEVPAPKGGSASGDQAPTPERGH